MARPFLHLEPCTFLPSAIALTQKVFGFGLEDLHQFWIHIAILIGNFHHLDRFISQEGTKPFLQPFLVLGFHHKDVVGPLDILSVHLSPGFVTGACRSHL